MSNDQAPVNGSETAVEGTEGAGVGEGTGTVSQADYDALKADYDRFKRTVAETTNRYAQAHNMCGVVDKALAELGLRRPRSEHVITVNLSYSYRVESSSGRASAAPPDGQIWANVRSLTDSLRYGTIESVTASLGVAGSAFPGLVIEHAEIVKRFETGGENSHLLTSPADQVCPNCDEPITEDNRAKSDGTCVDCGGPDDDNEPF